MKLIYLFIQFFLIYSCSKSDKIVVAISPVNIDALLEPKNISLTNEYYLIQNLSIRLIDMDSTGKIIFLLAKSLERPDSKTYVFTLNNYKFSDGTRIYANDVYNSFQRILAIPTPHSDLSSNVDEIKILNKNKIKFKLKNETDDFLYYLTLADFSILHKTQYTKDKLFSKDWTSITSGPFVYSYKNNTYRLVKNKYYNSSDIYFDEIVLKPLLNTNTYNLIKNKEVDFGFFNINSYLENIKNMEKLKNYEVIGNRSDSVTYLALNIKSNKFRKEYNRRWLLKKIINEYSIETTYSSFAKKSYHLFIPNSFGFVLEQDIIAIINNWKDVDLKKIPLEFKSGLKIKTHERMFEVSPMETLSPLKNLGINIIFENDVKSNEFQNVILDRNYDIFLSNISMDVNVITEPIRYLYFSNSPILLDPQKKIELNYKRIKASLNSEERKKIIYDIVNTMIEDSEFIPLHYISNPIFYNNEKIKPNIINQNDSFSLWKILKK